MHQNFVSYNLQGLRLMTLVSHELAALEGPVYSGAALTTPPSYY